VGPRTQPLSNSLLHSVIHFYVRLMQVTRAVRYSLSISKNKMENLFLSREFSLPLQAQHACERSTGTLLSGKEGNASEVSAFRSTDLRLRIARKSQINCHSSARGSTHSTIFIPRNTRKAIHCCSTLYYWQSMNNSRKIFIVWTDQIQWTSINNGLFYESVFVRPT
jgi:hypothetical protein